MKKHIIRLVFVGVYFLLPWFTPSQLPYFDWVFLLSGIYLLFVVKKDKLFLKSYLSLIALNLMVGLFTLISSGVR